MTNRNIETVHIDRSQLIEKLAEIQSARFITITATTVPSLRKTAQDGTVCPFWAAYKAGRLLKTSTVNGQAYVNWKNKINKQRTANGVPGDYEPLPRKWGERVVGGPFVRHTTKEGEVRVYFELAIERSLGYVYLLDGQEIDAEQVEPFLPPQPTENRYQIPQEDVPFLRDYQINNIDAVNYRFHEDDATKRYEVMGAV